MGKEHADFSCCCCLTNCCRLVEIMCDEHSCIRTHRYICSDPCPKKKHKCWDYEDEKC